MISRLVQTRHDVLNSVCADILKYGSKKIFGKKNTIHADLELLWMDSEFQEQYIAPCSQFQIVIARVKPGQKSRPHFHENGASSFIVLDKILSPVPPPAGLVYRYGQLLPWGEAPTARYLLSPIRGKKDIFPYQIHQFENRGKKIAHILIVTHPIISIETGWEDTHFIDFEKE